MNKNQKGFAPILILAIIAVVVVAGYFLFIQRGSLTTTPSTGSTQYQQQYKQANENVPAIQSSSDLNTAANDLDNTDTTQVNTQLNQLSSDASAF